MDVDNGESAEKIGNWAESRGITWGLAPASTGPLRDYRVTQQSTALGIDPSGEIVLRKNGGLQNEAKWREWLDTLAGTSMASAEPSAPSAASVPAAPAPVEVLPTPPPTPAPAAPAPTSSAPQPTIAAVPTTPPAVVADPTVAPPPTAVPVPTVAPPPPTAVPRPQPTPTPAPTATPNIPVGHNVGQRAADFTVTAVDGSTHTLSDVTASGKAVVVYFFATW